MTEKEGLAQGVRIWRANKLKSPSLIFIMILLILSIFFLYLTNGTPGKIIFAVFVLILLYGAIKSLSTHISIWSNGIKMNSVKNIRVGEYINDRENVFVNWRDIKEISIVNHLLGALYVKNSKPFLLVKTNNGKRYEALLYDSRGFINSLKKMGKSNLLNNK